MLWFLVNDRVKLLAYRVFDPTDVPLLVKKSNNMAAQIPQRAYQLYEQRGRHDGHANQDWLDAEHKIQKV